ncbi:hypothetical protein HAX54_031904, partial [Datura stramonium]|nr:hypothetical protein [Datura stramonium]
MKYVSTLLFVDGHRNGDGSLHIEGARSQGTIATNLANKLRREPIEDELFRATY